MSKDSQIKESMDNMVNISKQEIQWYQEQAKLGELCAMVNLGIMYKAGVKGLEVSDEEAAKYLKAAVINAVDYDGNTALHYAIRRANSTKKWDNVKLLINNGADVTIRYWGGRSPVLFVLQEGRFDSLEEKEEMIELFLNSPSTDEELSQEKSDYVRHYLKAREFLIERGANINKKNKFGLTDLMLAARHMNVDAVKYLLKKGADIYIESEGCDALMMAANKNRRWVLPLTIEHSSTQALREHDQMINPGDIYDIKWCQERVNSGNFCAMVNLGIMYKAGVKGLEVSDEEAAKYLQMAERINEKDRYGNTALHYAILRAASNRQWENVKLLINNGADVDIKDCKGCLPVVFMLRERLFKSSKGGEEITELLVQKQKKIDTGELLFFAIKVGYSSLSCNKLIEGGVDVNSYPFLALAVSHNRPEIVATLLEKGAQIPMASLREDSDFSEIDASSFALLKIAGAFEGESAFRGIDVDEVESFPIYSTSLRRNPEEDIHLGEFNGLLSCYEENPKNIYVLGALAELSYACEGGSMFSAFRRLDEIMAQKPSRQLNKKEEKKWGNVERWVEERKGKADLSDKFFKRTRYRNASSRKRDVNMVRDMRFVSPERVPESQEVALDVLFHSGVMSVPIFVNRESYFSFWRIRGLGPSTAFMKIQENRMKEEVREALNGKDVLSFTEPGLIEMGKNFFSSWIPKTGQSEKEEKVSLLAEELPEKGKFESNGDKIVTISSTGGGKEYTEARFKNLGFGEMETEYIEEDGSLKVRIEQDMVLALQALFKAEEMRRGPSSPSSTTITQSTTMIQGRPQSRR